MKAFIEGFGIGLAMVVFIGPVLFTLLQGALQSGFMAGFMVAVGIIVSDIVAVALLVFLGAGSFFERPENQLYIGIIGAVILFGFGLKYILSPSYNTERPLSVNTRDYLGFFVKGFLVNFVNPFVFAVWIGVIGLASARYGEGSGMVLFLAAVLAGIFTTDTLKAVFAHKISHFLKPKYLVWIYRAVGVLMIGFGVRMLWLVI